MSTNTQKLRNEKINQFLNSFFDTKIGYSEKEVNGYWLVRMGGEKLVIAIYAKESFEKYKKYNQGKES